VDPTADGFRPVAGGDQVQSGEMLLVEAYALIWLFAFVFLLLSWRRQRAIDGKVAELEAQMAKVRERTPPGEAS
jgi:hypothetical protein